MPTSGKRVLKPHVAKWLDELDSCCEKREQWDSVSKRLVTRDVLLHPAPAEHIGRLRHLIWADSSVILPRSEAEAYLRRLKEADQPVPAERKNFPANYHWIVIRKWDSWRMLRVIARIEKYVDLLPEFWENYWQQRGGGTSPYTRDWIRYENLVDAYRFSCGREPNKKERTILESRFPAIPVIQRIEQGGTAQASDIAILKPYASPWCRKNIFPLQKSIAIRLDRICERIDLKHVGVPQLEDDTAALYASLLALDVQARHQQALPVVRAWNHDWAIRASGLVDALGNATYIKKLREIMPLQRVHDPILSQKRRINAAKIASKKAQTSNRPARSEDEVGR